MILNLYNYNWIIILVYNDTKSAESLLSEHKVPTEVIEQSVYANFGCGSTFTNYNERLSLVLIAEHRSKKDFLITLEHELDHVKWDIRNTDELDKEGSAYMAGYLKEMMIDNNVESIYES